jgi:hypothetical protein
MTARWIRNQPVLQPVEAVARGEHGLMDRWILSWGFASPDPSGLESHPDAPGIEMRLGVGRRAGNDPVEIVREP